MGWARRVFLFAVGGVAFAALALAILMWLYGSFEFAVARLQGNDVVLSQDEIDVSNEGSADAHGNAYFTVKNLSGHPIMLTGSRVACDCVRVSTLPASIGPGETKCVPVSAPADADSVGIRQRVVLYTDSPANPELVGTVAWRGN